MASAPAVPADAASSSQPAGFSAPVVATALEAASPPKSPTTPVSYSDVVEGDATGASAGRITFTPDPTSTAGRPEPRRQLKDPLFLLLFLGHIVALVILGGATSKQPVQTRWFRDDGHRDAIQTRMDVAAVLSALGGLGWSVIVFSGLRPKILYFSQAVAGVLLSTHAILLFAHGYWGLGVVIALLVLGDTLWMLHARPRVRFVQVLLDVVVQVMRRQQQAVVITVVAVVVQTVYLIMWSHLLVSVLARGTSAFADWCYVLLLVASLRWTCGLVKHVVTVTVSGSMAVWLNATASSARTTFTYDLDEDLGLEFGMPGDDGADGTGAHAGVPDDDAQRLVGPPGGGGGGGGGGDVGSSAPHLSMTSTHGRPGTPFLRDAKLTPVDFLVQAMTTNLGSVCAGAAVGVVSPVLWALHRASRRCERHRTRRMHRWAVRLSAGVDAVLRRSHKYAYTQVATKGKSWFASARDTWKSFMARGVEGVVYDDCSDRLLLFGCYVGGSFLALVLSSTLQAGHSHWLLFGLLVFWFGFVGVGLPLTMVEGSVSSLMVCFAEVPASLSHCHPIIYHRFVRISELRHFRRVHGDNDDDL